MRGKLRKVRMLGSKMALCLIGIAFLYGIAIAGKTISMHCTSCGFSSDLNQGGGWEFEQFGGYCVNCEKFVYISWGRREQKPDPIGNIWDSSSGKRIPVYKCPVCSKSFVPFQDGWFKYCPKCAKKTFEQDKSKEVVFYD
jgi:hypothetical protein